MIFFSIIQGHHLAMKWVALCEKHLMMNVSIDVDWSDVDSDWNTLLLQNMQSMMNVSVVMLIMGSYWLWNGKLRKRQIVMHGDNTTR